MGVREFATVKKLNEIHKQLKDKFKDSANDIKDAQQLEDFFNYSLLNSSKSSNCGSGTSKFLLMNLTSC